MKNSKMAVAGALCTTVLLFNTVAVGQETPKVEPKGDEISMVFPEKPEFLIFSPKEGEAAIERAVYPPQFADNRAKKRRCSAKIR